jgi:hypothetical protein
MYCYALLCYVSLCCVILCNYVFQILWILFSEDVWRFFANHWFKLTLFIPVQSEEIWGKRWLSIVLGWFSNNFVCGPLEVARIQEQTWNQKLKPANRKLKPMNQKPKICESETKKPANQKPNKPTNQKPKKTNLKPNQICHSLWTFCWMRYYRQLIHIWDQTRYPLWTECWKG